MIFFFFKIPLSGLREEVVSGQCVKKQVEGHAVRAHQPNVGTMQLAPIPKLTILPIYIKLGKIKITTAQAREALSLHLHHRVSSQSAGGNNFL